MTLDWQQLICDRRYSYRGNSSNRSPAHVRQALLRSAFEIDYDRIIYSQAFRRLGKKTQVHPMESNAHIHNRLTHSLEVASVGRSFARRITQFLAQRQELPCRCEEDCNGRCYQTSDDLAHILMASCLVHDIGNPPFGHAGEYAIREWAENNRADVFFDDFAAIDSVTREGIEQDIFMFEGNAQGFRLAARRDIPSAGYLHLTYSTLAAMVKYPWSSTDPRARAKEKYNFFSTEESIANDVFDGLGLLQQHDGQPRCLRHPLSFLSEAADDICYSVIDIEDAVEMKILDENRAKALYCGLLGADLEGENATKSVAQLRAITVGSLIDKFWKVFESDYDSIMQGQRVGDLKSGLSADLQTAFKSIGETYKTIFGTDKKVRIEVGAYKLLGRIFKALCNATLTYSKKQNLKDIPFIAKRCLALAWDEPWLKQHAQQPYQWWLHEVIDFISGLTDDEAYVVSNAVAGLGTI